MTDTTGVPTPDFQNPDLRMAVALATLDRFANARDQVLWEVQGEIAEAAGILLRQLAEIGMFNGGINPHDWLYERPPGRVLDDTEAIIAEVREYAQDAEDRLAAVLERHDWLSSGRPLRCYACGQGIDPEQQGWLIDAGLAEDGLAVHDHCYEPDPAARARNLAATVAEDHYTALCEDRTRTGRPLPGDVVELDLIDTDRPDGPGTRTVQGVWQISIDGAWTRVEITVPPTGTPAVGELVDPLDAEAVRVVWLAEPPPAVPADGRPVAADAVHLASPCPRCGRPLVPGLPAVWLTGQPTHRACALTAGAPVTTG